jgi:hypothetical protein
VDRCCSGILGGGSASSPGPQEVAEDAGFRELRRELDRWSELAILGGRRRYTRLAAPIHSASGIGYLTRFEDEVVGAVTVGQGDLTGGAQYRTLGVVLEIGSTTYSEPTQPPMDPVVFRTRYPAIAVGGELLSMTLLLKPQRPVHDQHSTI